MCLREWNLEYSDCVFPLLSLYNPCRLWLLRKIQSFGSVKDILELHPLVEKWQAFKWHVQEIDGHHHTEILQAVTCAKQTQQPSVIIAHTIKGKGVSFMENQLLWHYRSPDNEQRQRA